MKGGNTPRATHNKIARAARANHFDTLVPKTTEQFTPQQSARRRGGNRPDSALCSDAVAHAVSALPATGVTVRDVNGAAELRACQELQRRAWGITEDGYVLPVATMAGAQKVGGLILGAFDPEERLLGFAFAFLGRLREQLILYSQLTGVHPAQQGTGVGRLLKFEQRRRARGLDLASVVWAFDPLQASTAAFNLAVLGATCQTYEVDLYGARTDALNVGLATDRLLAEWPTATERVGRTDLWPDTLDLIASRGAGVDSVRHPPPGRDHVSIAIPPSLAALKASPGAGQEWQSAVRQAFEDAFGAGFQAVGFSRAVPDRPCYLLERTT